MATKKCTRKSTILAALALLASGALTAPVQAKEKCTSMCHFFEAWAITKICPRFILNDDGRKTDREFGDLVILKQQALRDLRRKDACKVDCQWQAEAPDTDQFEGTACQYLRLKQPL